MKNAVKFITVLLATFLVSYALVMTGLVKLKFKGKPVLYMSNNYFIMKGGNTYQKFLEFDRKKKYDVIVIGSSRAYRNYVPSVFGDRGYSMFNLGTSAQTMENTYRIVRNYIDSSNTKLLILDVFWPAFNPSLESSLDLIANINDAGTAFEIASDKYDARSYNMFVARELESADKPLFIDSNYAGAGYSMNTDSFPSPLARKMESNRAGDKSKFRISAKNLALFEQIIQDCHAKGVKLVIVHAPVSKYYSWSAHTSFLSAIDPVMNKYNVPFIDYSKDTAINTMDHFYDASHMNFAGASIFTEQLISDLETKKYLKH